MVDLPSTANVVSIVRAPTPGVSPSQVASPYLELAQTLGTAAKETGDVSKLLAHEAGLKAVTRDAAGNLRVDKFPIIGDAAQSFEHAVKYAALADGEGVARRDEIALRQQHHDNPEGYLKAADAYRQEKVKQYSKVAGTEVGLALGKAIDQQTTTTYKGLLNEKERLELARSTASIESQNTTTTNELYALKSQGLSDDNPEIQRRLQTIGANWGTLMNNPRLAIPKERVEFEMSRLKSELAVAGMGYRVGRILDEQGPQAAAAEVDQIRTDPNLNLTPSERFSLHSRLMQGITQQVRANDAVDKMVGGEIEAVRTLATQGYPPSPERMGALRQQVEAGRNPALANSLRNVETILPVINSWRAANPATLERSLTDLDRHMREKGASEDMVALRKTGDALLQNMRKALHSDPLGWSDQSGQLPIPPLDFASKDITTQLRDRVARAEQVSANNGIQTTYLRPDERAVIEKATAVGGAPMLQVAATIVDGAGDRAPRMLSEVSKESPILAHIGGLMTSNGSPGVMRDAAESVTLKQDKTFKHPRWLEKETDAIQAEQHNKGTLPTYGGAFFLEPDTGRAAAMTGQAAFYTRSARAGGFDPKLATSEALKEYTRSLQEAAGATFQPDGTQVGGVVSYGTKPGTWFTSNKVLIPGNIKENRFSDVIGAIRDDDVAGARTADGKGYTARDFRRAVPVAVRGGYRFAVGDPLSDDPQWIRGETGDPFVLDLERLEPALRKRVPGAYAGR